MRQRRSVYLGGHDTADGEEAGTSLRISKQFRKVNSPKSAQPRPLRQAFDGPVEVAEDLASTAF
jgi:hypothetical protein